MKKSFDEKKRNEVIGLGQSSMRKNYYRELVNKQKDLEEQNRAMALQIEKRVEAEAALKKLNEDLEFRVEERTKALETSNQSLKTTLDELEKTYAYLLEVEKLSSLTNLVTGIAHELNTPLGVSVTTTSYVMSLIERLIFECKSAREDDINLLTKLDQIKQGMILLMGSVTKSADLVKEFKQISIIQDKYTQMLFSVYEYSMMVIHGIKRELQQKKNIHVHVKCSKDMIVNGYPGLFSQLLSIFLSNSLAHAFDELGGNITIDFYKENKDYIFHYKDDGRGMSDELITRIYEPFFTTNRSGTTPGLGMYAAYNLVTSIGGSIICDGKTGFDVKVIIPLEHHMKVE